jgi:YihY family inner membrane protein
MATQTKVHTEHRPPEAVQTAQKGAKSLQEFWTKFNNDWVMSFAAGLAFNLITAIFPILIAILGIAGLALRQLSPSAESELKTSLQHLFPGQLSSQSNFLTLALNSLNKSAGFLLVIAILLAIFGGSRLFVTIEGYFDIIYHTRPRDPIKQNIMAVSMLLVFVVLTPLMIFASSIPAIVHSILKTTPLNPISGNAFIYGLAGILVAVLITWVLFEAIYLVVPNQHISFRNSWLGALVAAVGVQLYLVLFPFYVTHFLGSYTGTAGFAVILLFFFYYFAVILLLGAEINAFYAEGVHATPDNLVVMVHTMTSHLPTSEQAIREEASVSHKNEEPKEILSKSEVDQLRAQPGTSAALEQPQSVHTNHRREKRGPSPSSSSRTLTIVEVVVGTALAFLVQLLRLRRKK